MAAIPLNLLLERGTDWDATFNIQNEDNTTPLNLTGYTAEAKLKKSYYSSTSNKVIIFLGLCIKRYRHCFLLMRILVLIINNRIKKL